MAVSLQIIFWSRVINHPGSDKCHIFDFGGCVINAKLPLVGSLLLFQIFSFAHASALDGDMQAELVAKINEECEAQAQVRASAQWTAILDGGLSGQYPSDYKERIYYISFAKCALTQQVLVLQDAKEVLTDDEWLEAGGPEQLYDLREKLIELYKNK
ncbi:hypothetical protein QLQ86_17000 [Halomonas sp. LR5S13]|uniref:hypothetical protein n=1 Tax=Halomonas rhizosphaerae TaxID=3043296 RepID=UPI0024A86BC1|nr:hypothetical protein [Halomonas rhizosphaerae]MDI5922484.1 hypothetical protein [Halomonas rhizosphaerae]